jgi:hypothetical protein
MSCIILHLVSVLPRYHHCHRLRFQNNSDISSGPVFNLRIYGRLDSSDIHVAHKSKFSTPQADRSDPNTIKKT